MGCVFTIPEGMEETVPYVTLLETAKTLFGTNSEWTETERGRHGYKSGLFRGDVYIWFDGGLGMGVFVELSGSACRQLEAEHLIQIGSEECPEGEFPFTWTDFINMILLSGGHFTRLDVAVDDFTGVLDTARIKAYIEKAAIVTSLEDCNVTENYNLRSGKKHGCTCYVGSKKSNMFVRIYNKQAEQFKKHGGKEGFDLDAIWNRLEMQVRKDRAQKLAELLVAGGMGAFAEVLNEAMSIREVNQHDDNRSRWSTASWWSEFIGTLKKASLWTRPEVRTVADGAEWLEKQAGPLLSAVMDAPDFGYKWLKRVLSEGAMRRKKKHQKMLEVHSDLLGVLQRLPMKFCHSETVPVVHPWRFDKSDDVGDLEWKLGLYTPLAGRWDAPYNPLFRKEVKAAWVPRPDLSWSPN
jgi:phage replication initiation protein